jgi:RHS repeat-associated protein
VVLTNGPHSVLERNEYEPYGQVLAGGYADRPGFTGHVADAQTGMNYMQQRYYDPAIGRFLSVDPVTALSNPVGMFNRYDYAADNPYKFKDPDGRMICFPGDARCNKSMHDAEERGIPVLQTDSDEKPKQTKSIIEELCPIGNSMQKAVVKMSDFGTKTEFAGLALAGYGLVTLGPEGSGPGLAMSSVGGLTLFASGGVQVVGGVFQRGSDPTVGDHNIAAGILSMSTFGATNSIMKSFMRNGKNSVARSINQRVELRVSAGGAMFDFLTQASDFFEAKQANCPVPKK